MHNTEHHLKMKKKSNHKSCGTSYAGNTLPRWTGPRGEGLEVKHLFGALYHDKFELASPCRKEIASHDRIGLIFFLSQISSEKWEKTNPFIWYICKSPYPICEFFCLTLRTHTGTPHMQTGTSFWFVFKVPAIFGWVTHWTRFFGMQVRTHQHQ